MSAQPIEAQVLAVLRDLSPTRQAEILDFALFLGEREQAKAIPNGETTVVNEAAGADEDYGNDPLARFIGAIDSGGIPWAEEHDRYLGEALFREMQGGEEDDDADNSAASRTP